MNFELGCLSLDHILHYSSLGTIYDFNEDLYIHIKAWLLLQGIQFSTEH